jgi:large subunit ribosomal protein L30
MPSDKGAETRKTATTRKKKASVSKKVAKKKTTKQSKTSRSKKTAASKSGKRIRVRQVRSGVGHSSKVRRTLTALGLKHHQDEVMVPDNPSVRGMIRKVHHLVCVNAEES